MTGGQGRYTLALSHYEAVPPTVQAQLAAQFKPHEDE
jgi:elongation factor G